MPNRLMSVALNTVLLPIVESLKAFFPLLQDVKCKDNIQAFTYLVKMDVNA